jgi:hypothetical protein
MIELGLVHFLNGSPQAMPAAVREFGSLRFVG